MSLDSFLQRESTIRNLLQWHQDFLNITARQQGTDNTSLGLTKTQTPFKEILSTTGSYSPLPINYHQQEIHQLKIFEKHWWFIVQEIVNHLKLTFSTENFRTIISQLGIELTVNEQLCLHEYYDLDNKFTIIFNGGFILEGKSMDSKKQSLETAHSCFVAEPTEVFRLPTLIDGKSLLELPSSLFSHLWFIKLYLKMRKLVREKSNINIIFTDRSPICADAFKYLHSNKTIEEIFDSIYNPKQTQLYKHLFFPLLGRCKFIMEYHKITKGYKWPIYETDERRFEFNYYNTEEKMKEVAKKFYTIYDILFFNFLFYFKCSN